MDSIMTNKRKITTHLTNISLFRNITGCVDWLLDLLFNTVTLEPVPYVGKLCKLSIPV
jgi:hypothetical protein